MHLVATEEIIIKEMKTVIGRRNANGSLWLVLPAMSDSSHVV